MRRGAYGVYLLIAGGTAFGAACAYTLNLVYQIRTVGLGPLQLVLVGTVLETVYLVAQVPTGLIADLHSRRLSVIVGVLLTGVGTALPGVRPTFAALLAGTVLYGVGAACFDGALEAWAADELGEARIGAVLTRGAQVGQACTVLGMAGAAGLSAVALWLPVVAGGAVWLLLGLVLIPIMPERYFEPVRESSMRSQLAVGLRAARTRPVLMALAGATLFVALGREGFDRLGQDHLLAGAPSVVLLGALAIVATLLAIPLTELLRRRAAGRTADRTADRVGPLVFWCQTAQIAAMAGFALTGAFVPAAAAWIAAGVLRSAAEPLMTTWLITQTESATRATVLSAIGMAGATGEIVGGPPVGWIGSRFSVGRALLASALLTAPAVAFLGAALRRPGLRLVDHEPSGGVSPNG